MISLEAASRANGARPRQSYTGLPGMPRGLFFATRFVENLDT